MPQSAVTPTISIIKKIISPINTFKMFTQIFQSEGILAVLGLLLLKCLVSVKGSDSFSTAEAKLETCQNELRSLSNGHLTQLQTLINDEATKLKKELELTISSVLTNRNEWEAKIAQKRSNIQTLKRNNALKDQTLVTKFDCKASAFTIKQCKSYCTFPYSYDSCTSNSNQLTFVQRLEAAEGRCLHYSYTSASNQKCHQIHVVVN